MKKYNIFQFINMLLYFCNIDYNAIIFQMQVFLWCFIMAELEYINNLSDDALRKELMGHGKAVGPITDSTRHMWRKKLLTAIAGNKTNSICDQIYYLCVC